jgi:cellulose synthase/poly-beta-1,6-N-acetylglucosamine synthase-like glycosyltransferase
VVPPPKPSIDVSVLVPVLNEEAHIREATRAMQSQRFDGELEFLFMDGRSEDETRSILEELARQDARIRVIDNPARRLPTALNQGLREARGRFIVRMDAHSYYSPDYIARGVERLERGDVAWVSGPPTPQGVGPWSRRIALALESWLGTGGSQKWPSRLDAAGLQEIELDTSVFGGVWRRETLTSLGGWDEGWPVNEDSELAARVLSSGGRIVCLPELEARYVPRDSLQGLAIQYWRYGLYRSKTSLHHPESLRRSHLLAPGVVVALAAAVLAPPPVRTLARVGLAAYALAVVSASAQVARRGTAGDAAGVPAVFATMHLSWGAGFLAGCARFGPPLRALGRAVSGSARG